MLLRALRERLFPAHRKEQGDSTAEKLRKFVSPCAACGSHDFLEHEYGQLGCTVASRNSENLQLFLSAVNARDWKKVAEFKDFDGRYDAAVANAVFCSRGGYVIVLLDRADLRVRDEKVAVEQLAIDEAR